MPRLHSLPAGALSAGVIVAGLFVVSLYMRTRGLGASLWMDEGLSIGIASQPLLDIPGLLRQDGSPPLYYMLLSVWMDLFGSGPGETQGLSVAISMLAIPGGLWGGWSLFDRRAGLIGAALGALNPFLTVYAQETRMYSLMVVLSLLTTVAFLHVFVFRRRNHLPVFAIFLALMLYAHNWGIFVTCGALAAGLTCLLMTEDRRALLRDGLLGFGGAGLLYAPWLPTLAYQISHTGAPWLNPPRYGVPIQISKSLLGGGTVSVAMLLGAGSGLVPILRRDVRDRERLAIIAAFVLCAVTLGVAWVASQISPAWTTRYLGVALGPIIVLAALGLSRARGLGIAALVIVLGIWMIPRTSQVENKSNASQLGTAAAPIIKPGDLVVVLQPEQHPLINYHLPPGLNYATELGAVDNPFVMDWRDVLDQLEDATPERNLIPLLDTLPCSQRVLLVHPVTSNQGDWDAPWTQLVRRRSAQWGQALERDPRFRRTTAIPTFYYPRSRRIGVRGVVYTKECNPAPRDGER